MSSPNAASSTPDATYGPTEQRPPRRQDAHNNDVAALTQNISDLELRRDAEEDPQAARDNDVAAIKEGSSDLQRLREEEVEFLRRLRELDAELAVLFAERQRELKGFKTEGVRR